nr:TadE/TadG family type IV pilus assembly protein [Paenibacillus sp. NFR01]
MKELRHEEGSFTLEASMLLPILMGIAMLLLFFCLYSYQKSMLQQMASAVSERAAYSWDNSHKQSKDGSFSSGSYDSLYWRISEDALLQSLFGLGKEGGEVTAELPFSGNTDVLPMKKLGQAADMLPAPLPGRMNYDYGLQGRSIETQLSKSLRLPVLDDILSDSARPQGQARSFVAEPVEFIRTVDLMRYYGEKFKGAGEGTEDKMNPKKASAVLNKLK